MSGLIRISGGATVNTPGGGGSSSNTAPTIRNFRAENVSSTTITIKYIAEDAENAMLRSYIYINDSKKEITRDVKINEETHEYEYTLTKLTKNTPYKLQVEVSDSLDTVRSDVINISTKDYIIYGVRINENNSNPDTCVEYIEDCIGFTPIERGLDSYNIQDYFVLKSWDYKFPFSEIELVGFKDGVETKKINPNGKNQYMDNSPVPADVDIMAKIPKTYWKFTTVDSNCYEIRISNNKFEGSDCYAHKVNGVEKDYIYIGVYLGCEENGKLRSKVNVYPTENTIDYLRTLAQANGKGYQQMTWFTQMLLQIIYVFAFKSLHSVKNLGLSAHAKHQTGQTKYRNTLFYFGAKGGLNSNVVCYIEDAWSYFNVFFDGITETLTDGKTRQIKIQTKNSSFEDTANYDFSVSINKNKTWGYINKVNHTNETGFLPIDATGSNETYYCGQCALTSQGENLCYMQTSDNRSKVGFFATRSAVRTTKGYSRLVYLGE